MSVAQIKNPTLRRLNFIWFIPAVPGLLVMRALVVAWEEVFDLVKTFPEACVELWNGRR